MKFFNKKSLSYLYLPKDISRDLNNIALSIPSRHDTILGSLAKLTNLGLSLYSLFSSENPYLEKNSLKEMNYKLLFELFERFMGEPELVLDPSGWVWYRWDLGNDTITFKVWGNRGEAFECWFSSSVEVLSEKLKTLPSMHISQVEGEHYSKYIVTRSFDKKKDLVGEQKRLANSIEKGKSYLFVGPPGNGKTSTAKSYLEGKRYIHVDNISMDVEFAQIVIMMKPDAILVDDCDRIGRENVRSFLSSISIIKSQLPDLVIFLTSNSFDGILSDPAVTRKQRIDHIIEISNPGVDEIREILRLYLKTNLEEIDELAHKLVGKSCADVETLAELVNSGKDVESFFSFDLEKLKEKYSPDLKNGIVNFL